WTSCERTRSSSWAGCCTTIRSSFLPINSCSSYGSAGESGKSARKAARMYRESDTEILRLRAALRDLVAVSTIPVACLGREPADIAVGVVDVLSGSLCLDFAFVRLCDPSGAVGVE